MMLPFQSATSLTLPRLAGEGTEGAPIGDSDQPLTANR